MEYRIDSHKLIYHPKEVNQWMETGDVFPVNVEIGLSGACNHRCIFCGIDYMGYAPNLLSADIVLSNLREMYKRGTKSVVFAGDGEPLLNKEAPFIINETRNMGVDVAMSTNGVLFSKEVAEECMESLTWMRFSTSAFSDENYQKIHRARKGDIDLVFQNISGAAELKRKKNLNTTIGVQMVLIPDNVDDAYQLGKKVRELGADYFVIKTFGHQPQSGSDLKQHYNWDDFYDKQKELEEKITSLSTKDFDGIFRTSRLEKRKIKCNYKECHALPFFSYIDSAGNVWPCCILMGNEGMCYGNICEKSFAEIWDSDERRKVVEQIRKNGLKFCSPDCRLNEMNWYLQELKYPNAHVNFI